MNQPGDIIDDLRLLEAPIPWWQQPWFIASALTLLAIAAFLLWQRRRRRVALTAATNGESPETAHEDALAALERLFAFLEPDRSRPYAIESSGIVRRYLERRFDIRAPLRSTEEFLQEAQHSPKLTPDQQALLGEFLGRCDFLKFVRGGMATREELQDTASRSRRFRSIDAPSSRAGGRHFVRAFFDSLHGFRFADPWLLLALLLLPLWSWLRGRYAPVPAVQFSSANLLREASRQPRFRRNRVLWFMRLVALALLIVAWARPQVEKGLSDREAMGINMMLALDFSGSMKTKDFLLDGRRASRADSMKKVFAEFIRARENDKVGVVRFDASAALISPLTLDHDWLLTQLAREETTHGTNVGDGMVIAANALLPAKNETKVIILATDADNINEGPQPADVSRAIAPLGIKMHVIQIVDFKDMGGYVACGPLLQEAAKITGGQFFQVADANGLRNVYRQIDQLEKTKFKENKQKTYRELMIWFAGPGCFLLLAEALLANTLWRRLP